MVSAVVLNALMVAGDQGGGCGGRGGHDARKSAGAKRLRQEDNNSAQVFLAKKTHDMKAADRLFQTRQWYRIGGVRYDMCILFARSFVVYPLHS